MHQVTIEMLVAFCVLLGVAAGLWSKLDSIWKAISEIKLDLAENFVKKADCEKKHNKIINPEN